MMVASTAANRPTKIEISAPLIALSSTSRPRRSAPNGSVSARGGSLTWIFAARSFHSSYFGASGSMSDRSTGFTSPGTAFASGSEPACFAFGPMKVGGASGTATSFCQSRATRPTDDSTIISTNTATTASDTMPTRSPFRRRHAVAHTPRERAGSAGSL